MAEGPGPGPEHAHEAELPAFEAGALALAREAGRALAEAFCTPMVVSYKDRGRKGRQPVSAVSALDRDVERRLRELIAERFPAHRTIGEELESEEDEADWLWVLDPVDGTANFVNGFPLFACSVGLLHRGAPVAGAIWCAATHRLAPGVYHARRGGGLGFEGQPLAPYANRDVRRHLAGLPAREAARGAAFDPRVLGTASSECAYVAAGLLRFSLLRQVSIWDVAAGVLLVRAAGLPVLEWTGGGWRPFERFHGSPLRSWRGTLALGRFEELPER